MSFPSCYEFASESAIKAVYETTSSWLQNYGILLCNPTGYDLDVSGNKLRHVLPGAAGVLAVGDLFEVFYKEPEAMRHGDTASLVDAPSRLEVVINHGTPDEGVIETMYVAGPDAIIPWQTTRLRSLPEEIDVRKQFVNRPTNTDISEAILLEDLTGFSRMTAGEASALLSIATHLDKLR